MSGLDFAGPDGSAAPSQAERRQGFAVYETLQRLGSMAWLIVGIVLVLVGAIWVLGQTSTIGGPLVAGAVIAAVAAPAVAALTTRRVPRVAATAMVLLALIAVGVLVVVLVLGGVSSQSAHISGTASRAVDKVQGWLEDVGVTSAGNAAQDVKKAVPEIRHTLLTGLAHGISGLTSIIVFLGFTIFSTFFMLKDGPSMRRWAEHHMGLPLPIAQVVTGNTLHALRQYFLGLTIVGAFNGAVVGLGALALHVPLPGTIALVTMLASYVPILGAWTAGFFAFALALGAKGPSTALIMALIVFLANGPLQQIVQPITFGATLGLNPLVVLAVTISAGSLFGMLGLVLAAPLTSAAVNISRDLSRMRDAREGSEAKLEDAAPI